VLSLSYGEALSYCCVARFATAQLACFELDIESLYGPQWVEALTDKPDAVVLAEGSEVTVFSGIRI
jgi:hypothetical protein